MVWATMASADFSTPIGRRRRRPAPVVRRDVEISQGKTLLLPSNAAGFTCAMSAWLLGFPVLCRVTPPHLPAIRCLFVGSEVCLKAASPPTSRRRGCHRLTVPANRPVEDSHLLDQCHAWHTVVDGRPSPTMTWCSASGSIFSSVGISRSSFSPPQPSDAPRSRPASAAAASSWRRSSE
jgi:hypothetical protein